MKRLSSYAVILMMSLSFTGCNEDESCDDADNSKIDDICYYGFLNDYDIDYEIVDGERGDPNGETLAIEFRGSGPTYILSISPGTYYYDNASQSFVDEPALLTEDVEMSSETTKTNISDVNSGRNIDTGELKVTLTKVDRENKLVSGRFTWNYTAFGNDVSKEVTTSGSFQDILVQGLID